MAEGTLENIEGIINEIPNIVKTAFPDVTSIIVGNNNITDVTLPAIYIVFSPLEFAETDDDTIGTKTATVGIGVYYEYAKDQVGNTPDDNIYKFGTDIATTLTNALFNSSELNTYCLFRDLESIDFEFSDENNSSYSAIEMIYRLRIEVSIYNV